MADIVIVAHHDRPEAAALALEAVDVLARRGHAAWMPPADAAALGLTQLADARLPSSADLMVSLGGDGTMLRAVSLLDGQPVPIIGVNVGLLGYLAEVEPEGMSAALQRWSDGSEGDGWSLEQRMMLTVEVRRSLTAPDAAGSEVGELQWTALNEAVIEKREPGHTVRLMVEIDGEPFTSYAADGLIIATPTGSTAYSLSARGPVVSPRHRAVLITPVSAHMMFDRALVLDPDEHVTVEVIGHRQATLSIDGRHGADLAEGDIVAVRPSSSVACFVRFGRRRFHQILKAKFGLEDR